MNLSPADVPNSLVETLEKAHDIVLTTHRGPDGDGVGACLALALGLTRPTRRVRIINQDPLPPRYAFLDPDRLVTAPAPEQPVDLGAADLLVLVDTCEIRRAGAFVAHALRRGLPGCAIDHHVPPPNGGAVPGYIDPDASSTGELAYRLLQRLGVPLTPRIADCLYAALIYDTQNFRFIRNHPGPLRVAGELLAAGADAGRIDEALWANRPAGYLTLLGRTLSGVEYLADGAAALLVVRPAQVEDLGLDSDEVRDLVSLLNQVGGVKACALVRERPGEVKISFRSRPGYDVAALAGTFHGGGHVQASGATVKGESVERVVERLRHGLARLVTAAGGPPSETRA